VTISSNTNPDTADPADAPEALTILETRVFHLAWNGATQIEIATRIQRDPRTVARILTTIAQKIGDIDAGFLRLRLEAELLARIPSMSTRELIAALRLYQPRHRASPPASPQPAATPDMQQILKEVMATDVARTDTG
jgi:DNA-binding CsgD family transcriptional regulator